MPPSAGATVCLFLAVAGLAACTPASPNESPSTAAALTPSPTPFAPVPPTPTLATVRLWMSPAVPPALRRTVVDALRSPGSEAMLVTLPESAEVSLEPSADTPVAEWVFALVAPFPTVEDGMTIEALRQAWAAGDILSTSETAEALRSRLGDPTPEALHGVGPGGLLDEAWAARPSLAIVPFEDLEPRWKVLEVDGLSPIRADFVAAAYPLTVSYGLRGSDAAVSVLRRALSQTAGTGGVVTNRDPDRLTTVVMTGVTALARATAWRMEVQGVDYPGLLIGDWLRQADLTHTSNEVAFSTNCPTPDPHQTSLRFCSDPRNLALLEDTGIDVIELTGNHILDWGAQAFLDTLSLYQGQGLAYFGGGVDLDEANRPFVFVHNGNRLAFVGCNAAGPEGVWAGADRPGGARCDADRIAATVGELRAQGYLPIFTFQWAESYRPSPLPDQVAGFRAAVDAGAVIVSGSQAHRPQGFEFYGGALIHYGLGNLFFDQMWSEATRQELIDRHVFYDGRHISTEILTAYLEDYAQPRPMTAGERAALLAEMFAASGW